MQGNTQEISKVAQTFTENTVAVPQRWSDNCAPGINFSESAFTVTESNDTKTSPQYRGLGGVQHVLLL